MDVLQEKQYGGNAGGYQAPYYGAMNFGYDNPMGFNQPSSQGKALRRQNDLWQYEGRPKNCILLPL